LAGASATPAARQEAAMIRLSGCIEMLYREEHADFVERVGAATRAGLPAVEFWRWRAKDLDRLEAAIRASGSAVAGFAVEPAGSIVDSTTHEEFLGGVTESCAVANRLGAGVLIVLAGAERSSIPRPQQHNHIVDALRRAAPIAEAAGVTLCLEPLNTRVDHAGYYLTAAAEGFAIVRAVGSPRVKLLYDIYHQQITEGFLIETIVANVGAIGHIHVADVPGRHEPGTGEINYVNVLRALDRAGYGGYIGLEFRPRAGTDAALAAVQAIVAQAEAGA
jgi:hydroxypyruvate isomerase